MMPLRRGFSQHRSACMRSKTATKKGLQMLTLAVSCGKVLPVLLSSTKGALVALQETKAPVLSHALTADGGTRTVAQCLADSAIIT